MSDVTQEVFPISKEYNLRDEHKDACRHGTPDRTTCPRCRAGRNRRAGMRKQRAARKALGVKKPKFQGLLSNEETWGHWARVEVKSGAQVGPIATRFLAAEKQSHGSRAIGDSRPFIFVAMPKGMSDGLVLCRLSDWEHVLASFLEACDAPSHNTA